MSIEEQNGIAISVIEECISHGKRSTFRLIIVSLLMLLGLCYICNPISVFFYRTDDSSIRFLFIVYLLIFLFMSAVIITREIKRVKFSNELKETFEGVLEYELACAEGASTWYRFIFSNCINEIIKEKPNNTFLIFSYGENGEISSLFEKEIGNSNPARIWHLLCRYGFNERNISIFDSEKYEVITLFLENGTEKLKLLHFFVDKDDYQLYSIPSTVVAGDEDETIFGNFISKISASWNNFEPRTKKIDEDVKELRQNIISFLELLPK